MKKLLTLLLVLSATFASGQNALVRGRITDENAQPIAYATVIVKGTSNGALSDADGNYAINAPRTAVLQFSFLGYQTFEIPVAGKSVIDVKLTPDTYSLDELVVVGYGTVRRGDLTGSISSLKGDVIEGYTSSSLLEAIGGRLAGVQITQSDGTPGSGFDIKVRGIGTITGDASPLYIVDGFPVSDINYLDNSDIESIDVLKDASAAAIYGAQAANGVMLITTKSGTVGRPTVRYSFKANYRSLPELIEVLSPYEFVKLQIDQNLNYADSYFRTGVDSDGNPYRFQELGDFTGEKGINWQSEMFKPTWSLNHNLSLSGGNKETTYLFSFARFDERGLFKGSAYNRTNAKMRITQKITDFARIDATINYINYVRDGISTNYDQGQFNMFIQMISARPTAGYRMTDEELKGADIDPMLDVENVTQFNPITQLQASHRKTVADQWQGNLSLKIDLMKDLSLTSAGSYRIEEGRTDQFYTYGSRQVRRGGSGTPEGRSAKSRSMRWTYYNHLNYRFAKSGHKADAMLGHEMSFRGSESVTAAATGFEFDVLGNDYLGAGATPTVAATSRTERWLISYFGRANYSYKDRYLATATLRRDGSSVFGKNHKWGWFPSFSVAWRASEEVFLKNAKPLSNLKVRFGYGVVGNDRITTGISQDPLSVRKYGTGTSVTTVLAPSQLPNPDIKWEASATTNLGLDVGLFKNRLELMLDVFQRNSKDLLLQATLPGVTGFGTQVRNIGEVQNRGIEVTLNSMNLRTAGGFTWRTSFNISFIRNKLVSLTDGESVRYVDAGYDNNNREFDYIAMVGRSIGIMYGYKFDGIYQYSDFEEDGVTLREGVVDMSEHYGEAVKPGMAKYRDQDGNGRITTDDRCEIGNGTPKSFGGLTNMFAYKGFDLAFTFQFSYGNDIFNATRFYCTQTRMERRNMFAEVADRWTPENPSNSVPSTWGYKVNDLYSRFIEDGSYLRLKDITMGYTLPRKWTGKFYVKTIRVYCSAQNLFVLTNYSGFDPETNAKASNPLTPGVDWGAYPRTRLFTFGIDMQF